MDPNSDEESISPVVVGQILGPHCLYCMLCLSRLIFKIYKDLTRFHVFL